MNTFVSYILRLLYLHKSINQMGCANSSDQNPHHCCPPGSWPAISINHFPQGQMQNADGLKVYHVGTGNKALVLFQDIFGIESGRHQAVADTYAILGYNVFMPEFLDQPYSGSIEDVPKILQVVKKQQIADIKAKYEKLAKHINGKGLTKWFTAGYCWGAWLAFHLSTIYDDFIAIGAMHPSFQCEGFYGGKDQDLAKKIKCPAYLYSAGNDQDNVKTNGAISKILVDRFKDKAGVTEFPKQKHGWMVRSDPSDAQASKDVELCFKLSHEYFSKFA